jgi:hypothetical protein
MATTKPTKKTVSPEVKALKTDLESIKSTLNKINQLEINSNANLNAIGVFTLLILVVEFFRFLHSIISIH